MDTKAIGKNRISTVLSLFVLINIIGEVGNVIGWWAAPASQISLVGGTLNGVNSSGGILFGAVGAQNALIIGSVLVLAVAVVYAVSLVGLVRKQKWSPLVIIAISVVNRVLALVIFAISAAFAFWAVWTIILVVVGYLDYRKLSTAPIQS